ncbi:hypothetical protein UlMin_006221 [Ulmus minor]
MTDCSITEVSKSGASSGSGSEASQIGEVNQWLDHEFGQAGKEVPRFEYTPRSVAYLHNLATLSQAKSQASKILASDFRLKASKYRAQAARIREILENVGLAQEGLASNVVGSVQVLANVVNLLNIRDTELSSFLVAMGDISLRKTSVEEKRTKVQKILAQLEDDVAPCEAKMENWKTNLAVMAAKERRYLQQSTNYKAMLNREGYTPEISHGVLVEMAEHKKELEKKTKPINKTLDSYLNLPADKALAALTVERKKREYADAEKRLEDVLRSAHSPSE